MSGRDRSAEPPAPGREDARNRAKGELGGLFEQVYAQLRAMAQLQMRKERAAHTLHATELVHQAYLRLSADSALDLSSQAHFVHAVAEAMRRILIEHARRRARHKRGGDRQRVPLTL